MRVLAGVGGPRLPRWLVPCGVEPAAALLLDAPLRAHVGATAAAQEAAVEP